MTPDNASGDVSHGAPSRRMDPAGLFIAVTLAALAVAVSLGAGTAYAAGTARVTVGSPPDTTPQNHQNEPAVAVDASHPNVLVAGEAQTDEPFGVDFRS